MFGGLTSRKTFRLFKHAAAASSAADLIAPRIPPGQDGRREGGRILEQIHLDLEDNDF